MIIHDLHVFCMPVTPYEADTPLIIDADTVLPFPISLQGFQSVRRREAQILQTGGGIDRVEFHERSLLNVVGELPHELTLEDLLRISIVKRPDHTQ
jgi:hypothetical protein